MDNKKEELFKIIQKQLKNPPVIIWGSGATIPFGLPSMWALNELLKKEIEDFDENCDNLEEELGKPKYEDIMPEIKKVIWQAVADKDELVLQGIIENYNAEYKVVECLVNKFVDVHPRVLNIITTNYDRVIEHILAYSGVNYTDGFSGKNLSVFNENSFPEESSVNIVKVHGSLNWFMLDGEIRYLGKSDIYAPQIICPGKNKFQETYNSPYRELIQKSDSYINNAKSFLVVGFGFNDEHLTPRISKLIKKGVPIVVITKRITESCFKELDKAEKYVLLEETDTDKTKIHYKMNSSVVKQEEIIDGNYWSLEKFVEII
ncbi:SIR2 family protein [Salegentibacter sp. 24]|jgi:sugar-specific transcriptional regulator TrmB|uniref:SIR2 family protein n=1 Tax=Salegentibacter sp. 24 TaxID=2183986 RepID=UPI001414D474|nr:SIR2 family protein [Salegentibacter sp. 24]